MTKEEIRCLAKNIVCLYSASMRIDDDASVKKGKLEHLDTSLEPTFGWWVDCKVFVPENYKE